MRKEHDAGREAPPGARAERPAKGPALSRRDFIGATLAALPALALADLAYAGEADLPQAALSQEIRKVPVVRAERGVLDLTLEARGMTGAKFPCPLNPSPDPSTWVAGNLRYYEWDGREKDRPPYPAPTLEARPGERVRVHLKNRIRPRDFPPTSDTACDGPGRSPRKWFPARDAPPACFHGDNTTNIHYHGTHVTPDGSGDNVLVNVYPEGVGSPDEFRNDFVITKYDAVTKQYRMGQSPGTHWYHPHKHGSVALQIQNGMAGAFIIRGQYDDDLRSALPGLVEHVLVMQQINDVVNLWLNNNAPAATTCAGVPRDQLPPKEAPMIVNGQFQPTIRMRPGEIQLWRFVNATSQQGAHKVLSFFERGDYLRRQAQRARRIHAAGGALENETAAPAVRARLPQMRATALDGVQFDFENYRRQLPGAAHASAGGYHNLTKFELAPGNRADVLVKAPSRPGRYLLDATDKLIPNEAKNKNAIDPAGILLFLDVEGTPNEMQWPVKANYPTFPEYLSDIPEDEVRLRRRLVFSVGANTAPGGAHNNSATGPQSPPHVMIDGVQFDPERIDQVMLLGTSEEWRIENATVNVMHPFHIHINPFQVIEVYDPTPPALRDQPPGAPTKTPPNKRVEKFTAPYHWQDTIPLPPAYSYLDASGKTQTVNGHVVFRTRFADFAGRFVLHCHILGHEDRGMMQLLEVVDNKVEPGTHYMPGMRRGNEH